MHPAEMELQESQSANCIQVGYPKLSSTMENPVKAKAPAPGVGTGAFEGWHVCLLAITVSRLLEQGHAPGYREVC